MTVTVQEIQELKDYLVETYHNKRVNEQHTDDMFYHDTFPVPFIQDEATIVRTGRAARMIDGPAEHIITSNPQVFRAARKKGETDAVNRVSSELNRWARVLLRQNPLPYKEHVKNELLRGEAWIYILHNEDFNPEDGLSLPCHFIIPDPLIVFADPASYDDGRPRRVIMCFDRVASEIKRGYPHWAWSRQGNKNWSETVPFIMYFDEDVRYFEAAEEPLLTNGKGELSNGDGIQENVYGFVPLIHSYSGFGRTASDGDPASLAVGRLRWVRDLLKEQCAIRSTLNTLIFKYAHKSIDLRYDSSGPAPSGDIGEKYDRGLNAFNQLGMPPGAELTTSEDQLPGAEVFQHLYNIETQITQEDPLGQIGQAIGTSGRQQDIAERSGLRRYDTVVDNTALSFARAFGLGMRMIEKLPHLNPSALHKGDINKYYECRFELKAEDPIEQDRLRTLGSRLFQTQQIDHKTNLTRYQGYTDEEAEDIMDRILVDNVIRNNPIVAELLGRQLAQEAGMEMEYDALKMERQMMEGSPTQPSQAGSQGGAPREGAIETERGREETDMSLTQRGARRSPA